MMRAWVWPLGAGLVVSAGLGGCRDNTSSDRDDDGARSGKAGSAEGGAVTSGGAAGSDEQGNVGGESSEAGPGSTTPHSAGDGGMGEGGGHQGGGTPGAGAGGVSQAGASGAAGSALGGAGVGGASDGGQAGRAEAGAGAGGQSFTLPFLEDFEDGLAQGFATRPSFTKDYWSVANQGGNKAYRIGYVDAVFAESIVGDPTWGDVIVQADVYTRSDQYATGSSGVGLVVRFDPSDTIKFHYQLIAWTSGTLELYKVSYDTPTLIKSVAIETIAVPSHHVIKLVAIGSAFDAYFDGTLRFTASSALGPKGQVGVVARNLSADFDNLSVSSP